MKGDQESEPETNAPLASAAIAYLLCTFGLFYGLIATVDPYL
jgi:hypothetical protein